MTTPYSPNVGLLANLPTDLRVLIDEASLLKLTLHSAAEAEGIKPISGRRAGAVERPNDAHLDFILVCDRHLTARGISSRPSPRIKRSVTFVRGSIHLGGDSALSPAQP